MSPRLKRILLPLSVFTVILALIHWFMYAVTMRDVPLKFAAPFLAFMILALISMPVGLIISHGKWRETLRPVTMFAYFWTGFFFLTFSFVIVQFILSWIVDHNFSYWPWMAAILAGAWSVYSALSPPRIITHVIEGPPVMKNLTLVQISDLHVGMPFLNRDWLTRQVGRINDLKPDFVAVTGDLADGPFDEVSPELAPLAYLQPKIKKFYVTGNHEFIRGGDWETRLKELGFTVLHNTHETFERGGSKFMIAGVPDRVISSKGGKFESSPSRALKSDAKIDYRILLAHEPSSVFNLKDEKCDLILSGHTHGGQIFPFALFVRIVQPVVRGFKEINGTIVFAHMGTGYWGPPMRWLTSSEIVRFKWEE